MTVTPFFGSNENNLFVMLWGEFVRHFILRVVSTDKSEYYYPANSMGEAIRAMFRDIKAA